MNIKSDIIIIGAGAAGLICAQELLQSGANVLVLEARSRIGGRINTSIDPLDETPIELGAEFIHGAPPEVLKIAKSAGLEFYEVKDEHLFYNKSKLEKDDKFWDEVGDIMKKLETERKEDRSVSEFLKGHHFSEKNTALFTSFVEGFHAADLKQISEKGLAATEESDEGLHRFNGGYSHLALEILKKFPPDHDCLRFNTVVKGIDWSKTDIHIAADCMGTHLKFTCKKLVVTIPLGVMKTLSGAKGSIDWNPSQPEPLHEALAGVEMGDVQKITFRFRTQFWKTVSKDPVCFMHMGPEHYFPTWWSLQPQDSPHLVAWQGGPRAKEMALWKPQKRIDTAVETLAQLTEKSTEFIREQIISTHSHDWSSDPFSRGAYSYVAQDGSKHAKLLQKPFKNKIFWAGEATATGPARGTVHGAMASGRRAAKELLKTLS